MAYRSYIVYMAHPTPNLPRDSSLLYVYYHSMAQDGRPEASCGQGRCTMDSTDRLRLNIDALPLTLARKRPRRGPRKPPPTIRRSRGESTSRLAVRPTAHAVIWRCTGMVPAPQHVIARAC